MIVNSIRPGDRVLFNESFASTNESEGSEIAYDIIKGMREAGISVFMVTHFYILAELIRKEMPDTVFLSAERNEDGSRTYKIRPGLATRTGFGMDIYDEIFD
jgi:DNA mismatch repair ATPase MutS